MIFNVVDPASCGLGWNPSLSMTTLLCRYYLSSCCPVEAGHEDPGEEPDAGGEQDHPPPEPGDHRHHRLRLAHALATIGLHFSLNSKCFAQHRDTHQSLVDVVQHGLVQLPAQGLVQLVHVDRPQLVVNKSLVGES